MEITYENALKFAAHSKANPSCDIVIKLKKPSDFKLPAEPPLIKCVLYKKQKIFKNKKPGMYHFYDDKCLYFQIARRNLLKGVIFFQNVTQLEPIRGPNPKSKEKKLEFLGFRLHKNPNNKEFFSPDGKILDNVIKFLGKRIFQRNFHQNYKALKQLGRGNFATVYKSENIITKEKFAIKAFSKENLANKEEKSYELLMNEIKIMRNLDHPNVMHLREIYETEKSIYLVLDLYKGKGLDQYLEDHGKLDEARSSIILTGVLRGIQYLTEKKIMHRDIKLQNVLFKQKENKISAQNVIIVDFGLAQSEDDEKYIYTRCGTPGYVAPEILRAKDPNSKYSCACDVFSAGILLHLLLTGSKPFTTKNFNEVLNENKKFRFDKNDLRYSFLSNEALELLEKMLQPDPKKRITINSALKHDFFCSENLLSYPNGRSSLIFLSPQCNMKNLKSCINMSQKNVFNTNFQQHSPYVLKNDTKTKVSSRNMFDYIEKSDDENSSENDQSLFSNFYFNKTINTTFKLTNNIESISDSKNSFERTNNKNLSIKFTKPLSSMEKIGNKDNSSLRKNLSKIIYPFAENDDLEKKSNNSFHSAKGKSISTNTHQIRYSIDRNFKFDYEALKDSLNSNYHPKFWTNEDIQKLYGGKLKFQSGNSSCNNSFMVNKGE